MKANREKNLMKCAGSIDTHVKKAEENRKSKWWEMWRTSRNIKAHNWE